ncbi:MAG TPA: hypothetical protein VGJ20_33005 [Xanthobacteraceae bacterium]|jgi:hypothetical protein
MVVSSFGKVNLYPAKTHHHRSSDGLSLKNLHQLLNGFNQGILLRDEVNKNIAREKDFTARVIRRSSRPNYHCWECHKWLGEAILDGGRMRRRAAPHPADRPPLAAAAQQ